MRQNPQLWSGFNTSIYLKLRYMRYSVVYFQHEFRMNGSFIKLNEFTKIQLISHCMYYVILRNVYIYFFQYVYLYPIII